MGRARSGDEAVGIGPTGLRGRGAGGRGRRAGGRGRRAGECDDSGFTAVFGPGRGAAALTRPPRGAQAISAESIARRQRLADAGGIAAILRRASVNGAAPSSGTVLYDELCDVTSEMCESAIADGAPLRAHLAGVFDVPELAEVAEVSDQFVRWSIHRNVLRNCVKHDEAWLRERALIAHDKELGRHVERWGVREGRADWLELTPAEKHSIEARAGRESGALPMRGDWAEFVPELRATRNADRMTRADVRLLWVQHVDARFGRAAARKRAIIRAALRG